MLNITDGMIGKVKIRAIRGLLGELVSYLSQESCRYCGRDLTPCGTEANNSYLCLCRDCGALLASASQALWWLPIASAPAAGRTAYGPGPILDRTVFGDEDSSSSIVQLLPVATGGTYEGPLQKLIRRLKYDNDRLVVSDIVSLFFKAHDLLQTVSPVDAAVLVLPVPLHRDRERKRGYNQATLLARLYCQKKDLKLSDNLLIRTKRTRPQYGLSKSERADNVKGVFKLVSTDAVRGKSVLLIDDVFTSGATISECAALLRAHGAAHVSGLAAARAPLNSKAMQ